MKRKIALLFTLSFLMLAFNSFSQELSRKEKRQAKKEAKNFLKQLEEEGWQTFPGAIAMERQVLDHYYKIYEGKESGEPTYNAWAVVKEEAYDLRMAKTKARNQLNVSMAQKLAEKKVKVVESSAANSSVKKSKTTYNRTGRPLITFELFRKTDGRLVEVMVGGVDKQQKEGAKD